MTTLQVRLFGQFECTQRDQPCDLPAASAARSLLAHLFLHPGRLFPRLVLADLIAPDLPEAQALHALSQALWHVRRSLPGVLECDASQVGVAPQVELWVDALEFQALAERFLVGEGQPATALAGLRQAVDLYRGDLLEGYYDDWVLSERERLRELFLQTLEKLVIAYKAALQYQHALTIALRLVGADPLNEAAHREVMRLYHYLGRPAEALRQYEICQEVMRREFGLEPEAETSQIARAIAQRSGRLIAPYLPEPPGMPDGSLLGSHTVSAIPLIGRGAERTCLVDWLLPGRAGEGRLVLVEGEAGVGKTRLLQEAARDVEWRGAQVLWGKAMPLANTGPLAPLVAALEGGLNILRVEQLQHLVAPVWLQVLQPLLPGLAHNLPGLEPLPMLESHQAKFRLLEGLFQFLAAWSQINPLVIIIEDVHWADADLVNTLADLAAHLGKENIALVLSYRHEELAGLPEIQARLLAIRPATVRGRLALAGLDEAAVHDLIHTSLGAGEASPAFEGALHRETHGNPLFILEMLRGLYDEGVLRRNEAGTWITPYDSEIDDVDIPLPPAVEQVISHRLEQLPAALRDLLEGLAVLGGEFDFEMAACLGLADAPALVASLQALCKRRLLVEGPHAYHFGHDKIRQVVYEGLSRAQRTAWHQKLAAALEAAYPDQVEALARHYTEGQGWPKACRYQKLAAEKARQAMAYARAGDHISQAIFAAGQAGLPAQDRFELLCFREEILEVLGKRPEQGQDLEQMALLVSGDLHRLGETLRRRANWLRCLNRFEDAEAATRQSMELARQAGDESAQIAARFMLGTILQASYDKRSEEAKACFHAAAEYYHRTQNWKQAAEAHGWLARGEFLPLPGTTRIEEVQQALALAQQAGDQVLQADLYCLWAAIQQENGSEPASAVQAYQNALEIARTIGYRLVEARTLNNLANLYLIQQPDQALLYFDQAAAIFRMIGDERRAVIVQLNAALNRALLLGDAVTSWQAAETALVYAASANDGWIRGFTWLVMGLAAWRKPDLDTAYRLLKDAVSTFEAIGNRILLVQALILQAYIELDLDLPAEAIATSQAADALSRQMDWQPALVMTQAVRAAACWKLHRLEEADRLSAEASQRLTPLVDRLWVIHFTRYQVLAAQGRCAEAHQALEAAYRALDQMLAQLTPDHRRMSRQNVPEHRLILEAWQASQPRQIVVRLPRASAPLGRPLHADEWVEVIWTIAAPEDEGIGGKVKLRRARLVRLLHEARAQGAAPLSENLAQALGVSLRTIAGDLTALRPEYEELLQASLRGRGEASQVTV